MELLGEEVDSHLKWLDECDGNKYVCETHLGSYKPIFILQSHIQSFKAIFEILNISVPQCFSYNFILWQTKNTLGNLLSINRKPCLCPIDPLFDRTCLQRVLTIKRVRGLADILTNRNDSSYGPFHPRFLRQPQKWVCIQHIHPFVLFRVSLRIVNIRDFKLRLGQSRDELHLVKLRIFR